MTALDLPAVAASAGRQRAAPLRLTTDRLVCAAALLAFGLLVGFGGRWHAPWFDEVQAWLIARDGPPWTILSQSVRYEGSPGLWHLLLWGLQRLGYSFAGLWLVSSALTAVGAGLILFGSPFPTWLKLGFSFSYFMAFQYAVVARSYALDAALLPLLALLFAGRAERPLAYGLVLGLIANCNAHSFVVALPIGLEFAWTLRPDLRAGRGRAWAGAMLAVALGLAAVWQAWPPADISSPVGKLSFSWLHALLLMAETAVDRVDVWSALSPPAWSRLAGLVVSLAVLAPVALLCADAGRRWLFWGVLGGFLGVSTLLFCNLWHAGVLWLALLFLLWISWNERHRAPRWRNRWLIAALAVSVACQDLATLKAWLREAHEPYSGASAAAAALRARLAIHPSETVAALSDRAFAVQAWFPLNVFANAPGGPAGPQHYGWRADSPPLGPSPGAWNRLLATGPNWVLAGNLHRMNAAGHAAFDRVTAAHGYCVKQTFPGVVDWKGYPSEPDALVVYGRCAAAWSSRG